MTVNPYEAPKAPLTVDPLPEKFLPTAFLGRATNAALAVNVLVQLTSLPDAILLSWRVLHPSGAPSMPDRSSAQSIVAALAQLVAAVPFCIWFYRSYRNLAAFGVPTRHGAVWAVACFFVPIVNLARPACIAREIQAGSSVDGARRGGSVSAWWASFVAAQVAGLLASIVPLPFIVLAPAVVVVKALMLTSALSGMKMIGEISRAQAARRGAASRLVDSSAARA